MESRIKFFEKKLYPRLEISTLAIVDVDYNTAYNLSTRQTSVKLINDETRIDQYLAHIQEDRASLPPSIRYLVADGYYSKIKFIAGVTALDLEQIGKLPAYNGFGGEPFRSAR